jgi:hypothetical protein
MATEAEEAALAEGEEGLEGEAPEVEGGEAEGDGGDEG